jgi:thiamine-phosphate pyrophosphorylase
MLLLPRVYPILDTALLARHGIAPLAAAEAVLDAGAQIVQLRHKTFFSRADYQTAGQMAALCRQTSAIFVINDRADIAMLLDAALHLGQDDLPPGAARQLSKKAIIGFSTHNQDQLVAADRQPVDYLTIGPIFSTSSKQNPDPVVGLEELRRLRPLTKKPLVAIGGITRENAGQVWQAGADSIAIIGDLLPDIRHRMMAYTRVEASTIQF